LLSRQRDNAVVPSLQEAAVEIAVSQLGVHEEGGNNRGPKVDEFLASVGLDPGFAWCASFVYWCFRQAAQQLGLVNPCPRTAGAVRLWTLTEPICRDQFPAPGAIYVLDHGGGKGHAGIVESIDADGMISEISGNTNAAGSREGNAVARHAGRSPEVVHGGKLLGYLCLDRAAQAPSALVS
jgi:CHAP domain-containing protein